MNEVEQFVLKGVLSKLDAIKVKYKIITSDGEEFGTLEVVKEKVRTRTYTVPHGTASRIYKGRIEGLEVGGSVTFCKAEFELAGITAEHLQSAVRPAMIKLYGNGSQATIVTSTGDVQTIRLY